MLTSKEMIAVAVQALDSKKGKDIRVLYTEEQTSLADYFVICNGTSSTQVRALADAVVFGRSGKAECFLWGRSGETMGRYCMRADGTACPPVDTGERIDPMDYCAKAAVVRDPVAFEESLNETRTFLSRAKHRRTAHR